jgi:hypothetical protein
MSASGSTWPAGACAPAWGAARWLAHGAGLGLVWPGPGSCQRGRQLDRMVGVLAPRGCGSGGPADGAARRRGRPHAESRAADGTRGKSSHGSYDDMLRLFAAMEAVPWQYRQEMGQWMLQRLSARMKPCRPGGP